MSLYWKWHKGKENRGKMKSKAGKADRLAKADMVTSTSVTGSVKRRKHSRTHNSVTGGIKSVPRRVVSLVLVLVTLVSVLIIGVSGVSADSNDRVATYINLAANGEVTDGDTSGMTEDQLRFLGLYLSNFYVPFGTELGTNDDETTNSTKEDMTKSLQQKLAFSEDLSKSLVETIFGYTRSSLKDLSFYIINENGDGFYKLEKTACNYYNFMRLMFGRSDDVFGRQMDLEGVRDVLGGWEKMQGVISIPDGKMGAVREKVTHAMFSKPNNQTDKKYNDLSDSDKNLVDLYIKLLSREKIYVGYENNGKVVPVFDCYRTFQFVWEEQASGSATKYSPSQYAFMKCLQNVNIKKGYGFSMYDFAKSDDVNADSLGDTVDDMTEEQCYKMSIFGMQMSVDCFGDLVCMGGNHQVVAVPGCMNPYVWKAVDSEGNDVDTTHKQKNSGNNFDYPFDDGSVLYLNSAILMSEATQTDGNGNALFAGCNEFNNSGGYEPADKYKDTYNNKLLSGALKFKLLNSQLNDVFLAYDHEGTKNDGNFGIGSLRLQRGADSNEFDETFKKFLKKAVKGFRDANPNDQTCSYGSRKNASWDNNVLIIDPRAGLNQTTGTLSDDTIGHLGFFACSIPNSYTVGGNTGYHNIKQDNYIRINPNLIMIDNLGTYSGKDKTDYSAFNVAPFVNKDGKLTNDSSKLDIGNSHTFGNLFTDIQSGKMNVPTNASEQALCSLYVTYCVACMYDDANKKDSIGKLGYRYNKEAFPDMSNKPVNLEGTELSAGSVEEEAIRHWTYYLLHPTKGFEYVRRLITNKVNHLLLGWHTDMVGTNGVGATVGTTKYRSNMGYVTMPDLSEINWTNRLIQIYNDCIPFFIIALIIIMLFAFIVGALNLQHAAFGVLIFAVFTLLPVNLINGAVGYSNRISQNAYGDKFTYWALVQQESYSQAIDEAANAEGSEGNSSYDNYLRTLYAENEKVYTNQGKESIMVKWQAPKKMASLVLTEADNKMLGGLNETGVKMLHGMLNRAYSGQSYTDDEDAVYMYRSYTDLSNFSRYIYNGIRENTVKHSTDLSTVDKSGWSSLPSNNAKLNVMASDMKTYMDDGYTYGENFGQNTAFDKQWYIYLPLTSKPINEALKDHDKMDNLTDTSKMININADVFNFGLPQFNAKSFNNRWGVETFAATAGIEDGSAGTRKQDLGTYINGFKEEDFVGLAAFGLYSENPYYYFSWKLYNDGLKSSSSVSGATGYKDLLLKEEEGGYFYNVKGNKELKDFMNMKGLFTYIIPYMKQCNDMVRKWDETYGIFVYDGIPTEEGHWSEMTTDEMKQKYWHNLNVTRLYCLYCPWVDIMYDCSYSKAETINVMGNRVTIDDPIDPSKYPESRPMIFSASEMADYGLNEADLTSVEKKILRCNEQFEDRMYELLNYYNFSDPTLNSAAAINCAFVFNNMFSENGIFTENHNIYPQSFDLSNFSYDAFLRLILANATGESLIDASTTEDAGMATGDLSGDFYERLVNRSSTITVIIMLILDVLSVYLIPAFRIFFLVAIFLASIFIVLTSAFRIESSAKFIRKVGMQFFIPLIAFFLTTVAFSLIVGLFIGEGNNKVTETGLSISLGDPVVTMLVMIALDLILLFVYWKIIKKVLTDIRGQAKAVGSFIGGIGSAAVGFAAGAVAAGAGSAQDMARGVSGRYRNWKINRALKGKGNAANGGKGGTEEPAQNGTGVENGRANERGSSGNADYSEERSAIRDAEKDRGSQVDDKVDENSDERRANIDEKAGSGADIEGSDSDGRRNHRAYGTVGSNTNPKSADSVNSKTSSGTNTGNTSGVTPNRAPREKVKQILKPDAIDREMARRKGIPSTEKEIKDAIYRSVGKDVKREHVPRSNNGGNNRASDRGRKPVETRPNREKVSKPPKKS